MVSSDPSPSSSEREPAEPAAVPVSPQSGLSCGPLVGLAATLLAALITIGVVAAIFPWSELPERLANVGANSPDHLQLEVNETLIRMSRTDGILMLSIFAALAAFGLTLVEGRALGRAGSGLGLGLLGLLIGIAAAVIGGIVGSLVFDALWGSEDMSEMSVTIFTQLAMFGILGMGVGLAPALVHRRSTVLITAALGGLLGGGLAGLIIPILTSYVLPGVNTEVLVPDNLKARACMVLVLAVMIGLTVCGIGNRPRKAKAA